MASSSPVKKEEAYCVSCERFYPLSKFTVHKNEHHTSKIHYYCNDCCKSISQNIMTKYCKAGSKPDIFSYGLGMRHICSFFDMPYIQEVVEDLYELEFNTGKDRKWNYVMQYQSKLKEFDYYDEMYWNYLSGNTFTAYESINDKDTKPNSEGDLKLFNDLSKKWGKHIKALDDFLFLEETFETYANGEILTAPMTNMIKYLCHAELDVMKLKQNKADQKDITNAETRVSNYYTKLKLDDFKFNKSKSVAEKLIENWAYIEENYNPIEWDSGEIVDENIDPDIISLNPLDDRLGINKDYDDIMRALGNKVVGSRDFPTLTFDDVKKKNRRKKNK